MNFLILQLLFLQSPIPSEAWEITKLTPYNPLAYGVVLLLLLAASILFYRNWKEEVKYNKERDAKVLAFQQKMLELITRVELRLTDQKDDRSILKSLEVAINNLQRVIEARLDS